MIIANIIVQIRIIIVYILRMVDIMVSYSIVDNKKIQNNNNNNNN